jgi:hypothetical protein
MAVVARMCVHDFSAPSSANIKTRPEMNVRDSHFELKPRIINMVQQSPFCGKASEDANAYLQHFLEICSTFTIRGVNQDVVRLRLFPFSLLEKMKQWFYATWEAASARKHIDAAAGGSFFVLCIEEARALIEKMAPSQSWNDECTHTCTRKVHHLEEVHMLTAKIDLLMKKLEDLGPDHLKMVNFCMTCEECRETGQMGINCPMTYQDVNFVVNSNGFHPNQGFSSGWNKPILPFDNH